MVRFVKLCKLSESRGLDRVRVDEIPSMIDAYINGSNDLFHEDAFGEFLSIDIQDMYLRKVRDIIFKRVFVPPRYEDGFGDISVSDMIKVAEEIKSGEFRLNCH